MVLKEHEQLASFQPCIALFIAQILKQTLGFFRFTFSLEIVLYLKNNRKKQKLRMAEDQTIRLRKPFP